ncbi:phage baseplate assembly protein V [Jeongeupia naejangsanensis]|uniref:Phage baseplate assembly protein n=1 Tax=Jeongeupia naejangsanensis TaxID=613195 RepID=A0ABS2BFQ1_9NEIS|nr:phage baseplate assembly protein V [Jeongeupia naejangsanensis]MBM3114290.1 phage baseplate assembly protein [Jeongeupia naejangsanensis]
MSRIAKGRILRADDGGRCALLQVELLDGEIVDRVEWFLSYGLTALPLAGAECVVAFIEGASDHAVAIAVEDRRYRVAAKAPGELAIYTQDGARIALKNGRLIAVKCDTYRVHCTNYDVQADNVVFDAEAIALTASAGVDVDTPVLATTGDVTDRGGEASLQDLRNYVSGHTHAETGSETRTPSQVMKGAGHE